MTVRTRPRDGMPGPEIDAVLLRFTRAEDIAPLLQEFLDAAIALARTDLGTMQRFDDADDCLRIVASRGFSDDTLGYFGIVRRDTNTTCAVALTRRMHVFVEDIATSYLFINTPELKIMRGLGIVAVQSLPLISESGRFWGVVTTHFRESRSESDAEHTRLSELALQVANGLEHHAHSRTAEKPDGVGSVPARSET